MVASAPTRNQMPKTAIAKLIEDRTKTTPSAPCVGGEDSPSTLAQSLFRFPFPAPALRAYGADSRDSFASTAIVDIMDRAAHAAIGRMTFGLSPSALSAAYLDWASHLAYSPGKQLQLVEKANKKAARFLNYAVQCAWRPESQECAIAPLPQDKRFDSAEWRRWPYNLISQGFLFTQQWWHNATTGVRGVSPQHERVVSFAARQILDVFAPSNFVLTNPEVLKRAAETGGDSLVKGLQHFVEDIDRTMNRKPPVGVDAFRPGEAVGVTPGKVVYRNRIAELIQYAPTTPKVGAEPLLFIPAWIMKYYILDLSPENSLVRYLVDSGHTVFMVSWKNPGPEDRDVSFDDYRRLGVLEMLDAVRMIAGDVKVHGVGYCLGGTLLGVAVAAMAAEAGRHFQTLTFLASQFDFSEAGELTLFINDSQIAFLEDIMWQQGYLDTNQMAGAFQLLRSIDLIWSRVERDYLMGERRPVNDLVAWNADATRMPYRMHSDYLRRFFLNNDFAEGRYKVDGDLISFAHIKVPMFAVGTTRDHVAPWRSAYKIHELAETDVTFLLTDGGHNAGIISEPGHPGRHYFMKTTPAGAAHEDPDAWRSQAAEKKGSWWPAWLSWIDERSSAMIEPPAAKWVGADKRGDGMIDAPGGYVLMD